MPASSPRSCSSQGHMYLYGQRTRGDRQGCRPAAALMSIRPQVFDIARIKSRASRSSSRSCSTTYCRPSLRTVCSFIFNRCVRASSKFRARRFPHPSPTLAVLPIAPQPAPLRTRVTPRIKCVSHIGRATLPYSMRRPFNSARSDGAVRLQQGY